MRSLTAIVLAASFSILSAQKIVLPSPNGTYGVDTQVFTLTDESRLDPYAPNKQHRRLVLSAFYPTGPIEKCQHYLAPYMPPKTAALYAQPPLSNGSFEPFQLSLCKANKPSAWNHRPTWPVALFSPGQGASRLMYSGIAQALSSKGYIVITIDHPYDASVVEFPDGSLVLGANITTVDQILFDVTVRAADVKFLVKTLQNWTNAKQNPLKMSCGELDMKSLVMFGHSLGGATTAAAMPNVSSIRGGINLDGSLGGPAYTPGLERPFMLFGHEGKNYSNDATWAPFWASSTGPKVNLELLESQHRTFSDLPLLTELLGRSEEPSSIEYLGTLEGKRAIPVITAYVDAFFQFVLGKKPVDRLQHNVKEYPEIVVVDSILTNATS